METKAIATRPGEKTKRVVLSSEELLRLDQDKSEDLIRKKNRQDLNKSKKDLKDMAKIKIKTKLNITDIDFDDLKLALS